ncbi:MAG: TRZ/ATZ family hydrolase [Gammaproteobacteria bacterium]|nr:TRZ/ATZ family hydrolase [Gammaproteobacteria bacterium]
MTDKITDIISDNHIDTLITCDWIIPVTAGDPVLEDHAIAIHHGKIVDILPAADAKHIFTAKHLHDLRHHVVTPGFINAHTHSAMTLFRGMSDDLALMEWLNNHIWPAEAKWLSEDFVADGSRLAIAEMIKSGTTCFNDMYFFPDVTARIASEAGIRATIGLIVFDFPSAWGDGADDYLQKGLAIHDAYLNHPLIQTALAPHAPYTVSDAPLSRVRLLADELDIPVHIHLHETNDEILGSLRDHGVRPMARLQRLGLLNPQLIAVHMTQLTEEEIGIAAESGIHVAHCPQSHLKLASGFSPVGKLQRAGVNICIGTDGAASNNDLDMLDEMRTAATLAKAVDNNARTLPAAAALRAATINGAKALGIDDVTGSLEVGKSADMIAIDLDSLRTQPVHHPLSQVVYAASSSQVSDVWVNGRQLLANRRLLTLDENAILENCREWLQKIQE